MEDQLVSYEVAHLAKIKKFDIVTLAYYREKVLVNPWDNIIVKKYHIMDHNQEFRLNGKVGLFSSAPTQSLLQKWIRELHQIHIQVFYNKNNNYSVMIVDSVDNSINPEVYGNDYKTYELALEAGLLEVLTIIQ